MNSDVLIAAIEGYFKGERHEMLVILSCSLGLVILAAALYAVARDGFARGFGVTVLVCAVLLSSMAVSLLRRDPPHRAMLVSGVQTADAKAILATEARRVADFIEKYPYYRYAARFLGLLALAAVAIVRQGWVNGAAAGVLVLVVAQLTIDHYSEERAARYASDLASAMGTGTIPSARSRE